jgi:hypothetical protein
MELHVLDTAVADAVGMKLLPVLVCGLTRCCCCCRANALLMAERELLCEQLDGELAA